MCIEMDKIVRNFAAEALDMVYQLQDFHQQLAAERLKSCVGQAMSEGKSSLQTKVNRRPLDPNLDPYWAPIPYDFGLHDATIQGWIPMGQPCNQLRPWHKNLFSIMKLTLMAKPPHKP